MPQDDQNAAFDKLERQIDQAMLADRFRLRRQLREFRRQKGDPGHMSHRWRERLADSVERRRRREEALPQVAFDPALPVCQRADEIAEAIRDHQVVVVCGETGSGKSTQLPKICLKLGQGISGMIAHTQPRRIAARSVASRIAEELGTPLGRQVGFKIRFTDETGPDTYIKLMTDGMLLAELQQDRFFEQYDTIILDEAHERSLNIDFLIGCLKRLLVKRPELKLIITSATIDAARFAEHFSSDAHPTPVIEVSGRTYPVDLWYRPLEPDEETGETDWVGAMLDAADELARLDQGDMLVFLPTERDIHEAAKAFRSHALPRDPDRRTEILPLYARLSTADQQKVFRPHAHRRIVLATNVAESSLTVPGIRYVIDLGTARISRYSARSKTQRLPIDPISRASADQRAGRCGRVGPGICVRLYSEDDYLGRDRYTLPEIQRTNLASVILQMKALRLGSIESFPFLDPPRRDAVRDGYKTLFELGAIDEAQRLTELGRRLSRLPVDPRIGRMILAADEENCLAEVLIIAAALEVQDPRLRPVEHQEAADRAHAAFADERSDFLGYLRLWDFFHDLRQKLSRSRLQKACAQNFLSYNRIREWSDVHLQLRQLADEAGLRVRRRRDDETAIHRAVLAGLLAHVAWLREGFEYTTAGGGKANLWPGSTLFAKKPRWVVAAELVQTNRRYLRTCARIQPEWVESLAPHLVKHTYAEPHWDPAAGSAMAFESVSLLGLPVVPRRKIHLGPLDPETARDLMIREGLVEGQWPRPPAFLKHNQQLLAEIDRLEAKMRRRDLAPDFAALVGFYESRIPSEVVDGRGLQQWLARAPREETDALWMSVDALVRDAEAARAAETFPEEATVGGLSIPLDYRFEPGDEQDGVTMNVPLEALHQLDPREMGWLVPGLLQPRIVALIKSLPKPIRRRLVPAPDTAREVVARLGREGAGSLDAVARELGRLAGEAVSVEHFDESTLPEPLRMHFRVVDAEGNTLGTGRDLTALRRDLARQSAATLEQIEDTRYQREGITAWDFEELPRRAEVRSGGLRLEASPALVDTGDEVALRLVESPERAERLSRAGLRRLFALAARRDIRSQMAWLPRMDEMLLWASSIRGFDLRRQLADLIADRAFLGEGPIPRTRPEYEGQLAAGRGRIGLAVQDVTAVVPSLMENYHRARLAMEQISTGSRLGYAAEDVQEQLDHLVGPDFFTAIPWSWLRHFPRYFQAIEHRLEKLRGGALKRDQACTEEIQSWWHVYREHVARLGPLEPPAALVQFRWMLEEFRVSLFAERLGTAVPVSSKRLRRHWETLQK